jgi:uncharacterized protein YcsI (UPF0317 family)
MQKAVEGTPMQAKYAARFIAFSKKAQAPGELLDVSWPGRCIEVAIADLVGYYPALPGL